MYGNVEFSKQGRNRGDEVTEEAVLPATAPPQSGRARAADVTRATQHARHQPRNKRVPAGQSPLRCSSMCCRGPADHGWTIAGVGLPHTRRPTPARWSSTMRTRSAAGKPFSRGPSGSIFADRCDTGGLAQACQALPTTGRGEVQRHPRRARANPTATRGRCRTSAMPEGKAIPSSARNAPRDCVSMMVTRNGAADAIDPARTDFRRDSVAQRASAAQHQDGDGCEVVRLS